MFATLFTGARPFDLQATLDSWATAPEYAISEFKGKPKRKDDPTAEAWLDLVENGCSGRRVPRTHWPDVAKHFMVKKARARVVEVEKVMGALHGEQWAWTWKNFRIAFLNMGCKHLSSLSLPLPRGPVPARGVRSGACFNSDG